MPAGRGMSRLVPVWTVTGLILTSNQVYQSQAHLSYALLTSIASAAFALALLSVSNAQHATQQQQQTPHQSSKGAEPDSSMLLAALNDVDSYKSSTLICLYKVNMLDVKKDTYNYSVTGCKVDPEFVGRCPDLTSFPGCGSYNVVLTSKSKKPKVMSIKKASK
ncbi:hypothetical protein GN244_ATG03634 [Phytophthora infestans]|uniref:Uncharacterized protein n=1 Tax=Phytophthora infestans TaxID=4787 RepID=A0A833T5X5_PHYIN|nr:hypothetical protein GN244_ATG03634 [Phytophthora infestans]